MRLMCACAAAFVCAVGFSACEAPPAPPSGAQPQASPPLATIAPPVEAEPPPAPPVAQDAPMPQAAPATTPVSPMPSTTEPPPATESVKAEVGVGKKGRSLDEYEGVVVTPVKSLFATRERLTFDVAIPQALSLFQATEGRYPKTHEEFMEKIIKFNNIGLPELPEGHRYKWDPEQKELMVERPRKKGEPK